MAASMMMAPVASNWNVSGIRMAIPAVGPTPGSTPTSVPIIDPAEMQTSAPPGVRATEKPSSRLSKIANVSSLQP